MNILYRTNYTSVKYYLTMKRSDMIDQLPTLWSGLYNRARYPYVIDLSHQAVRALHFIGSSPTPPKVDDLRKYLDKSMANTSDIVNRLKDRGLVGKRRSDKDERVVLLELSAQGREALRQHTLLDPTQLGPIVDKLSASERATFMALLEKMLGC